ncbi:NUDIX hydrolase [Oceanirhabdus sp. W0125-5]|uniref:NUDIX hydrolase n=1 Tax=Oceanirhabdus sp. W0125-5 TaxID=2999116 RepID=UPI0022F2A515|nr:NUDIX domain-containing protein [Oceanirhabdus sp. W0125-5]WBW96583.1 NUDIX domain-containing protein [Oceanirhabdus sp. W0125-5]
MYIINVEGAIYNNDKWLMIKRSEKEEHAPGEIAFIGGKVEGLGFSQNILEENIKREIMEEVGVEVEENMYYVNSSSFGTDKGECVVDIVFLCKYKSGDPYCKGIDEVEEVFWISKEEIFKNHNLTPWFKRNIEMADVLRRKINL